MDEICKIMILSGKGLDVMQRYKNDKPLHILMRNKKKAHAQRRNGPFGIHFVGYDQDIFPEVFENHKRCNV